MDLDPAHLRSFEAIVRYGGYHRAADALHLTQPAVSRHIRRLEVQLGERLFVRRGRGVELTAFGERAAAEFGEALAAHDLAVMRLTRARGTDVPFVLATSDNLVDPLLPGLLAAVRSRIGRRAVQVRVDRSHQLVAGFARGEIDAVIVFDAGGRPDAIDLGPLTLRWYAAPSLAAAESPADPLPMIAYDEPCQLRELALGHVRELCLRYTLTAESPHLSGVQSAARHGLGYVLLSEGGDGLRPVSAGPLAGPLIARLWLLVAPEHRDLATAMRGALWRAGAAHECTRPERAAIAAA